MDADSDDDSQWGFDPELRPSDACPQWTKLREALVVATQAHGVRPGFDVSSYVVQQAALSMSAAVDRELRENADLDEYERDVLDRRRHPASLVTRDALLEVFSRLWKLARHLLQVPTTRGFSLAPLLRLVAPVSREFYPTRIDPVFARTNAGLLQTWTTKEMVQSDKSVFDFVRYYGARPFVFEKTGYPKPDSGLAVLGVTLRIFRFAARLMRETAMPRAAPTPFPSIVKRVVAAEFELSLDASQHFRAFVEQHVPAQANTLIFGALGFSSESRAYDEINRVGEMLLTLTEVIDDAVVGTR